MSNSNKVDVAFDKQLLDLGIEHNHTLDSSTETASYGYFGASGSGKSTGVFYLLHNVITNISNSRLWICDGKAYDYQFLENIEDSRYFPYIGEGDGMPAGMEQFSQMFTDRLTGKCDSRTYELIVLEEWSSVISMLNAEKATAPIARKMMAQAFAVTSQGRAYNVHALFVLQKPQMDFLSGFRENLTNIIALGRLSPEVAKMCGFNEFKHFNNDSSKRGIGWFLDNNKLHQIKVPHFSPDDFARFRASIIEGVTR